MPINELKMPIGESDFRRVIEGKYYLVDKSLFIRDILNDSASAILITRPRRFGKTLNLSMLRYFFTKEIYGETGRELFEGLKIQQDADIMRHQGRYPVIFLTFKSLIFDTFEKIYQRFCQLISFLYKEHDYLLASSALRDYEKKNYQLILEAQAAPAVMSYALKTLSEYLHRYHEVAPVILIDEYDTPIQAGYLNGYYAEVVELFRPFLGEGLKDNLSCSKAVLTGILRVSKESLFSGLNNLSVYSVLHKRYGEYFGFTQTEVEILLEQSNLKAKGEDIRCWYNGYQIGSHTIYNPWSILKCVVECGQLQSYWLNTSDNALVKDYLYQSGLIHKEVFEQLLAGQAVSCLIDEYVVFPNLNTPSKSDTVILSFLLMAGYFTASSVGDTRLKTPCQLIIPNIEIHDLYADLIKNWLVEGQQKIGFNEFLEELLRGDLEAFEQSFRSLLESTISVHDLSHEPEAFYHGLMTGLTVHLQWHPDYILKSNRESGYGRYDYLILSRVPEKPTLLMEFKRVNGTDVEKSSIEKMDMMLEKAAEEALKQIESRAYDAEARQQGSQQILKIAIAFCGKRFKLIYAS